MPNNLMVSECPSQDPAVQMLWETVYGPSAGRSPVPPGPNSSVASNPPPGYTVVAGLVGDGTTVETTTIQAKLTAATSAGGGTVLVPFVNTGVVLIDVPLIIGSNTELVLAQGVIIRLKTGVNTNILNNAAVANARTVMDAVVTVASPTLTSATAAFTSADTGKTLWVYGADTDGEILKVTLTYVNATTVTMSANAVLSVNPTQASIGPRDSKITIRGGTWDKNGNGGGGAGTLQGVKLRRCDDLTITDTNVVSSGSPKYALSLGDCTRYSMERIGFNYNSDGIHLTGPLRRGTVKTIRGFTYDDMVSVTPADWTGLNDVFGDIIDLTIEDVYADLSHNTVVKVLGGTNGAQVLKTKHIRVKKVGGYADNLDESAGGLVWLGDDAGQASTVGGRVDDVTVEGVGGSVLYGVARKDTLVYVNGSNMGTVRLRNLHVDAGAGTLHGVTVAGSSTSIDVLDIDGVSIDSASTSSDVVLMMDNAHVTTLMVSRVTGQIGRWVVNESNATNLIGVLYLDTIDFRQSGANGLFVNTQGAYLTRAFITNVHTVAGVNVNFLAQIGDYGGGGGVVEVIMANVSMNLANASFYLLSATTKAIVRAAGAIYLNGKQPTLNGGQLSSRDAGFPVDTALVNTNVAGDMAFHNNAAMTPYSVGPVMYDGTIWRPLKGFMASGTAVLVAGTKAVADTKITATSVIRTFNRTVGGVRGALWTENNNGVGFTIFSTNAGDTSTVYYEVEAY